MLEFLISSQRLYHPWEPKGMPLTCFSNGAGIWRVWVALVFTKVLRNVVTSQLCHNVWDVAKRTQVLKTFVSSTCQEIRVVHFSAVKFISTNIDSGKALWSILWKENKKWNSSCPFGLRTLVVGTDTCRTCTISTQGTLDTCPNRNINTASWEHNEGRISFG